MSTYIYIYEVYVSATLALTSPACMLKVCEYIYIYIYEVYVSANLALTSPARVLKCMLVHVCTCYICIYEMYVLNM